MIPHDPCLLVFVYGNAAALLHGKNTVSGFPPRVELGTQEVAVGVPDAIPPHAAATADCRDQHRTIR